MNFVGQHIPDGVHTRGRETTSKMSSNVPVNWPSKTWWRIEFFSSCLHHAWLARPPVDHPNRAVWEKRYGDEVRRVLGVVQDTGGLPTQGVWTPPILAAAIIENNRAFSRAGVQGVFDYERMDPDQVPERVARHFHPSRNWVPLSIDNGWWAGFGKCFGIGFSRCANHSQCYRVLEGKSTAAARASSPAGTRCTCAPSS